MCKKMYFRRRLKAGKNVFNVKTPSYAGKRLKYFENIGEDRLSPKSKSEYTKLKHPELKAKLSEGVSYPHMFMTKAGVKYSFDKYVENVKSEIAALKQKKIEMEEENIQLQIKKEKEEKAKEEELKAIERLRREREFQEQLRILSDQIKIKREENFHRKEMRRNKQDYLKPGVSARSGRVRKPNSFFTNDLFAFNQSDIEGFRKLSALQEKQRKVLAEMKLRENRAKRVNRVVVHTPKVSLKVPNVNFKLESLFKRVLAGKPEKQEGTSTADLEIDNPEKEDGVRKLEISEKRPKKKRKIEKANEGDPSETVKKKPKKYKTNLKSDRVLIGDFPDTDNVMKFLQEETKKPGKKLKSASSQSSITDEMTGTESTSIAYPHARSLIKASKEVEKKEVSKMSPDLMKGVMFIDSKQGEPVRFQVGSKQLMMAKCGEKLVFYSPSALQKQINSVNKAERKKTDSINEAEQKITIKSEPGVSVCATQISGATKSCVVSTLSTNTSVAASATVKTVSSSMYSAQPSAKSNLQLQRATLSNLLNPVSNVGFVQTTISPSLISLPFPFVSVPSTGANLITVPATQAVVVNPTITKPTLIVNPAIRSSIYTSLAVPGSGLQSLIPQLAVPTTLVSTVVPASHVSTTTLATAAVTLSSSVPKPVLSSTTTTDKNAVNGGATINGASANQLQTFAILSNQTSLPNTPVQHALLPATNAFVPLSPTTSADVVQSLSTTSVSAIQTTTVSQQKCVPTSLVKIHPISSQSTSTVTSPATTQSQSNTNAKKGKFYLLKVDGKHILIPVPDSSTPNATVQTKAYLVNEALAGSSTKSNLTPIPTQTVNMPLPTHTVNNPQVQRTGSISIPVLKRVNSQPGQNLSSPLSPQNVNATKPAQTANSPVPVQIASTITAQPKQPKLLPRVSSPAISTSVISKPCQTIPQTTLTSTQVLSYKLVTGYTPPGGGPMSIVKETPVQKPVTSLIPDTVASKVPKVVTSVQPAPSSGVQAARAATRFVAPVTTGGKQNVTPSPPAFATGIQPVQSSGVLPARSLAPIIVTVTTAVRQNVVTYTPSTYVTDFIGPKTTGTTSTICAKSLLTGATVTTVPLPSASIKPTVITLQSKVTQPTKVNDHEPSKSKGELAQEKGEKDKNVLRDNIIDVEETKTESVKEDTRPQPFVANREERLRKLKELIKQKNEAVEQIRQKSKTTSVDGTEATDIDGAEVWDGESKGLVLKMLIKGWASSRENLSSGFPIR